MTAANRGGSRHRSGRGSGPQGHARHSRRRGQSARGGRREFAGARQEGRRGRGGACRRGRSRFAFPGRGDRRARAERLLGIAVPREFGGEGASVADVVDVCYALGRACASTAMIYAMHQTKVACLMRHGRASAWHQLLLRRLANEQLLLASSTTEGQAGGDVRNSAAPIVRDGSRIALERQATVISYGKAADGIVTTARRAADAASSDQVLVTFLKDDYTLEPLSRLGRVRHARHLQRRLQARRLRLGASRSFPSPTTRFTPRP